MYVLADRYTSPISACETGSDALDLSTFVPVRVNRVQQALRLPSVFHLNAGGRFSKVAAFDPICQDGKSLASLATASLSVGF